MLQLPILALSVFAVQTNANYDHLKEMEWAIGTWRRAAAVESDQQGGTKAGAHHWRFAWTPNKNALLISNYVTAGDKTTGQLDSLFGWDRKKQQVHGAGFSTNGGAGSGWVLEPEKDEFTIRTGAVWVFKKKGKDRLEVQNSRGDTHVYVRVGKSRKQGKRQ